MHSIRPGRFGVSVGGGDTLLLEAPSDSKAIVPTAAGKGSLTPSRFPAASMLISQTHRGDAQNATRAPQLRLAQSDPVKAALEFIKPEGIFYGETHRVNGWLTGGNFGVISLKDGTSGYYGTRPVGQVNLGLLGNANLSLVGTNNAQGDEAGVNLSWRLPTPAGDLLFFANVRQDNATVGNLIDSLKGRGQRHFTASLNLGVMYSASDGAALLLSNSLAPGSGVVTSAALQLAGVDAWVGLGYRCTATFDNGQLTSMNLSGVKISAADIGRVFGNKIQQARLKAPVLPNFGSNVLAGRNDSIQLAFGQSPWDVGFAAIRRDGQGAMRVLGGTIDVLNHGNTVTAVTEPVYELGVKYKALVPGQRIVDNAHAGSVIERLLTTARHNDLHNKALGKSTTEYLFAMSRLMNPYNLDFGSSQLKNAFRSFSSSGTDQSLTNVSRAVQGLKPLPVAGRYSRPNDYALVRGTFQGAFRHAADNPAGLKSPQTMFRF
jgi:hypothetical protein